MYKYNVNTFLFPPSGLYHLTELEEIIRERLQLFKCIDNAYNWSTDSKEFENFLLSEIKHRKLETCNTLLDSKDSNDSVIKARTYNHIAHWLLSLSYTSNKELRSFFLSCEICWFAILFKQLSREDLQMFLQDNNFVYTQISEAEKLKLKDELLMCRNIGENAFNKMSYYKTHFSDIISLVKTRKVFLYKGYAYFPESDIIHSIKNRLWIQFSEQLDLIRKIISNALSEERLQDLINVPIVKPSLKYSNEICDITLENIDEIANENYPLCMKYIHKVLRENHHLKYDCKMQYGIFLKNLGLPFEEAIELFRNEFTKKLSNDVFKKKYSYLFKHQYGLVGSKINYKPYTCIEILDKNPDPDQHHGCPFKHWDKDKLLKKCHEDRLQTNDINEIRDLVAQNLYREACTLYFCKTHNVIRDEVFNNPNEYVAESYKTEENMNELFNVLMSERN